MRNMQRGFIQHFEDDETYNDESYERPRSPPSPRFPYYAADSSISRHELRIGSSSSGAIHRGIEEESARIRFSLKDDMAFLKRCMAFGFKRASKMLDSAAATAPPRRQIMSSCWIRHYSSSHLILLVGDGDFSFSACLAKAFGCSSNMTATSLDSLRFLLSNYVSALSNLTELMLRNCKVMHEIDATEMANHPTLGTMKFDRIIFNFPFAGFFKDLPRDSQLLRHRRLVSLFMKNAKQMISENGEIHITHKTNGFHIEWNLESLAICEGLRLIDAVDFNQHDYPGYKHQVWIWT